MMVHLLSCVIFPYLSDVIRPTGYSKNLKMIFKGKNDDAPGPGMFCVICIDMWRKRELYKIGKL